jgi:hypothetical protein
MGVVKILAVRQGMEENNFGNAHLSGDGVVSEGGQGGVDE